MGVMLRLLSRWTFTVFWVLSALGPQARADPVNARVVLNGPSMPMQVLLGYPAGGAGDTLLRVLAPALSNELGRAVTVENKPGAAGLLALRSLQQRWPEGTRLMLADTGLLMASLLQEPKRQAPPVFSPIAGLGELPYALVARSGLAVNNVSELIALLRDSPGRYTVATPGLGSMGHQAAQRFGRAAAVHLLEVPYKGGAPALADIAMGRVDLAFVSLATARIAASVGNARLLAISSAQRMPEVADIPALSETLPGFEAVTTVFLVGPAGMTPPAVAALERAVLAATHRSEVAAALSQNGLLVSAVGSEVLQLKLKAQWRQIQQAHR